jgi:hypothetical protein
MESIGLIHRALARRHNEGIRPRDYFAPQLEAERGICDDRLAAVGDGVFQLPAAVETDISMAESGDFTLVCAQARADRARLANKRFRMRLAISRRVSPYRRSIPSHSPTPAETRLDTA